MIWGFFLDNDIGDMDCVDTKDELKSIHEGNYNEAKDSMCIIVFQENDFNREGFTFQVDIIFNDGKMFKWIVQKHATLGEKKDIK